MLPLNPFLVPLATLDHMTTSRRYMSRHQEVSSLRYGHMAQRSSASQGRLSPKQRNLAYRVCYPAWLCPHSQGSSVPMWSGLQSYNHSYHL